MKKGDIEPLFKQWIEENRLEEKAESTLKSYKKKIDRFIQWLPAEEEITKGTIIAYKEYMQTILSKATTNNNIIALNMFLKYIGLEDFRVKQIKIQKAFSNEENLTLEDLDRLKRFAKKENDMQDFYIMEILTTTGIRIEELKYFTVENLKSSYIKVFNKGKDRKIVLTGDLHRSLKRYARENHIKTGYLFPSKQVAGKMINKSTIWRHLQNLAGKAKVKKNKVHAHNFRHLFAIQCKNNNISDLDIADMMGHNSLETTRRYTRSSLADKKKQLESISYRPNGKAHKSK